MKDLALRWLAGWSAATGHPWTIEDGVFRIEALMASRRFEYLLCEPSKEQFAAVAELIAGDSRDVVTVFTNSPARYLVPQAGLLVDRDDEALMTRTLERTDSPVPEGFETRRDDDGGRTSLIVVHGSELASAGKVAVLGSDAIFDRIETMPRYQRQGLGRFVMHSLTGWALDHEAEFGILAASADGQRLYETLGWKHECTMLMFRGVPAPDQSAADQYATD